MADPGKETITQPPSPPPPETETMDGGPAATATATTDPASQVAPAAVVEPVEGNNTTPPPPPQEGEPTDGVASAPDPALPTDESARPAPPQENRDAAAAGQPQQTATEATTQPPPPMPTKAEEVVAAPPPSETPPAQEMVATKVEAEKQLPATAAPAPPPAMEEASSVHKEEKDATPVMAQQEGEDKPEKKHAGPAGVQEGRRRWRQLQAAVRLIFLRCKIGDRSTPQSPLPEDKGGETKQPAPGGTQPVSGLEEKKPAVVDEGEMKPAALAGNQPASGQEQMAPVPRPPETSLEKTAADAEKPLATQQPPQKQEEDKDAAPAAESVARRRWRCLRAAVRLLFLRPKPATAPDGDKGSDAGVKPAPVDGKQPASGLEEKKKHPKWRREEGRLEKILEDAFTRLLATEFHQLRPIRKKCLLTFSVFDLAAEVKKQVMVYWWVSEFKLRHRSDQSATDAAPAVIRRSRILRRARKPAAPAGGNNSPAPQGKAHDGGNPDAEAEGIFSELSSHGFLEPARNWCSRVIHGCKVNPLVHWMVKRRARDDRCADLDANGKPSELQRNSSILCLTAGNRRMLQEMRMKDDKSQQLVENKPNATRTTSTSLQSPTQDKAPDQDQKNTETNLGREHDDILPSFKGKRVILNVNAHVYPVSKSMFLYLADTLVVLQLGRWCNLDDKTYMEVDGLESLSEIGLLKNLRCLSLRGLSRLTELPKGIQGLKKLAILDMRGCQNLVNVKITMPLKPMPLKQLTHLDLTECYMLEHIGRGITSLSKLQVFKGFVLPTGTQGNKACRVQDLKKLKNLQKLTISIATEANVGKEDMADLKHLTSLHKLTITWSEIPRILDDDSETVTKKREGLVEKWTSFDVPQELLKLDLRCYPKKELKLKVQKNLKKLYLRGGELEKFSIDEPKPSNSSDKANCITTLRLRYLKNFNMDWEEIRSVLKDIEYVEIFPKDEKPMKAVDKDQKDKNNDIKDQKVDVDKDKKDKNINMKDQEDKNLDIKDRKDIGEVHKLMENIKIKDQEDKNIAAKDQKDIEAESKLVMKKMILHSILDENGVWVKDNMEELNLLRWKALGAMEKSKGTIQDTSTEDTSIITDDNKHENDIVAKENSEGQRKIGSNP